MQKVINVIALLSGLTSLAVISGSAYILINQEEWKEQAQEKLAEVIAEGITGALPGLMEGSMPELPTTTGPELPF
jgi:hypothetical protein